MDLWIYLTSRIKLKQVWIQSFPSKLVALLQLKNLLCPSTYPQQKERWIDAFLKAIRKSSIKKGLEPFDFCLKKKKES